MLPPQLQREHPLNKKFEFFLSFFFMSVLAFLVLDTTEPGSVRLHLNDVFLQRHGFGSGSALLVEAGSGTVL
jgi:hypothetical protein